MYLIGCTTKNTGLEDGTSTNSESIKDELLYGKYPEPILIAIGENNSVKKNYKELTMNDLEKVKSLSFEREFNKEFVATKYGFKENEEYDFSIILEMPNLESLSIDFGTNKIRLKDYSILKKLNNLKNLAISNIHDSDVDNINEFKSLERLKVSNSDITNIEFLEDLLQLKLFSLEHCYKIRNFEALKFLKNIEQINLWNLNITERELSTIPGIPTLTSLSLIGNNLTNITSFPVFKNLNYLIIENNPLKSINIPSDNLPKLKSLYISDTLISDANEIKGMDTIEEINIKNTKITKVAEFKKYKNLKFINATLANIEDKDSLNGTNIWINEE